MDYEWTNRSPVKPAWSSHSEDPSTPKKRPFEQVNPATPGTGVPATPTFGRNQNVPFLFNPTPVPQTPSGYPWAPPPQFSPTKAFPQPEIHDVDMNEASPAKDEKENDPKETEEKRPVAPGALRRVYNRRTRSTARSRARNRSDSHDDSGVGSASEEDDEEEDDRRLAIRPKSTSNHYTLNLPAQPSPPSDLPYVLLGYTQFFFNLSLILMFLYLAVQFILTVQRDVEKRVTEYSQDIVQEIAMCATRYTDNGCATTRAPDLLHKCAEYEACMNRDPTTLGRARISAELIAEVINSFVEPISWKTLAFTLTSLAFMTLFINTLLTFYRTRTQPNAAPAQPTASFPAMHSGPYPSHPFGGFLSPAPTPNWSRFKTGTPEEMESPTRRRKLEGGASAKIK
ncbi:nuclear membrane protein [Coprinopsis cinerea okayama7|uniref:Nuclear membrane protein n=1 Tax=Coprinopsis cinerea (strain Okayama-7 / 130 / ATCC MYA-4618 / FGSC 9003) TaxID=240176 RepID=A8N0U3_COPC7|nr:nuclear membrane protein [Coprinopsis cinerea okayama7\|eukprot:XP_001828494.2 nuclear membrane protein [Coprinopsis cinerea okayama7\